jgi:glyoxylase-like metal-dependent hydrolase (beta-lactamase superfamily II)
MRILPIPMGICTSYLIKDQGAILVDAGQQGYGRTFQRRIAQAGLVPKDLTLIFLTHGHWDHIGCLGELKALSGSPAAIHYREKEWVERGLMPHPPPLTGWGRFLETLIKRFLMPRQTFGGVPVDIALADQPSSVQSFGVNGTVYPTPGHSSGSMSLVLATGEAFVGDAAVNGPPERLDAGGAIFAEQPELIPQSWRVLLEAGATTIYPAHGRPFKASALERQLQ